MRISPGVPLNSDYVVASYTAANTVAKSVAPLTTLTLFDLDCGTRKAGEILEIRGSTRSTNVNPGPINITLEVLKQAGTAAVVFEPGGTSFVYPSDQANNNYTVNIGEGICRVTSDGTLTLRFQGIGGLAGTLNWNVAIGDARLSVIVRRGE